MSPSTAQVFIYLLNFLLYEEQILLLATALLYGQLRLGTIWHSCPRALPPPPPPSPPLPPLLLPTPLLTPITPLTPTSPIAPAFPLISNNNNSDNNNNNNNHLPDFGGDNNDNNCLQDFGGDNNNNNSIVGLARYIYYNTYYINYQLIYAQTYNIAACPHRQRCSRFSPSFYLSKLLYYLTCQLAVSTLKLVTLGQDYRRLYCRPLGQVVVISLDS